MANNVQLDMLRQLTHHLPGWTDLFIETPEGLKPLGRIEQRRLSCNPGHYGTVFHAEAPKVIEREPEAEEETEDGAFPEVEVKPRKGGKAKANA